MEPDRVERRAGYHGEGPGRFFGWLHEAPEAPPRDCAVVICPPIGHEYTRSHRTLRHLADRLARRGVPALRFDYDGTGDSPGTELDEARVATWIASIRAAVARVRALTGRERVCVIGVRLGATLAAVAAREPGIDRLVLWSPVVKGRAFVRELQALSLVSVQGGSSVEGVLEAAGFAMTPETVASLSDIDLASAHPIVRQVLLVSRDDLPLDTSFAQVLRGRHVDCRQVRLPGWSGMMAEHQFTVVPDEALDYIVGWVDEGKTGEAPAGRGEEALESRLALDPIEERIVRFGPAGRLFGIVSRLDAREREAVILFNAGSVHHVGPNRTYVALARHLAAQGFACLRMDLTGIGDSVLEPNPRENHPYPVTAMDDARAAIVLLRSMGYTRFIAMGLCSGAHAAFHCALELDEPGLEEIVLINPYTFHWCDGESLETVIRLADAKMYRQSMRDPGRWMKLLRGEVNFRRLFEVVAEHPASLAKRTYGEFCERVVPSRAPILARDLRRLLESGRRLSLVIADGDPGLDILMRGAPHTARQAMKSGRMHLDVIAGGDHTFTPLKARRELIDRIATRLRERPSVAG